MRIFATAAFLLGLLPCCANAEPPAPRGLAGVEGKDQPAAKSGPAEAPAEANGFDSMCQSLESAARRNGLPVAFFTRLIWQESRFDAHAVSPAGARGVAQFMPGTATWIGLVNPFDAAGAIDKSAEFLRKLDEQFGNLGLAAAAYNAGPRRVRDWLDGRGALPAETEAYVRIVTGHAASEWRSAQPNQWKLMLPESIPCPQLVKLLADKPEGISPRDRPAPPPVEAPVASVWGLQLIGGPSEAVELAAYGQMRKKFKSVLGNYPPLVLRSSAGRGHHWYRVRVAVSSYFQAQKLCASLRAAGGSCLVQEN